MKPGQPGRWRGVRPGKQRGDDGPLVADAHVTIDGATYGEDGHQECDYVNDRVDVWVDPCGE